MRSNYSRWFSEAFLAGLIAACVAAARIPYLALPLAAAGGSAGALSWWFFRSPTPNYPTWRWVSAGLLTGILVHPFLGLYYVLLSPEPRPWSDAAGFTLWGLYLGWIFSLPAGVVASAITYVILLCRKTELAGAHTNALNSH